MLLAKCQSLPIYLVVVILVRINTGPSGIGHANEVIERTNERKMYENVPRIPEGASDFSSRRGVRHERDKLRRMTAPAPVRVRPRRTRNSEFNFDMRTHTGDSNTVNNNATNFESAPKETV